MGSREEMTALMWAEVQASGLRQVEIATNAGITEKHLSQIMRGHVTGSLDVLDAVLAACGRELVLATRVVRGDGPILAYRVWLRESVEVPGEPVALLIKPADVEIMRAGQ